MPEASDGRGIADGKSGAAGPPIGALVDGSLDFAAEARRLASRGFESVQLHYWASVGDADLGAAAYALRDSLAGSRCVPSALGVYGNPLGRDEAGAETRRSLRALLEAAPDFGAPLVSCFAGRPQGLSVPESIEPFKSVFGELCDVAARRGVTIALENCRLGDTWKTGRWNIAINPDAWELIFNALPGAPLGLEWEPAHQVLALADPLAQLEAWIGRVVHVHAKDAAVDREALALRGFYGGGKIGREVLAGRGDTDWKAVFRTLRRGGYRGTVDIELGAVPECQGDRASEALDEAFSALAAARAEALG